MVVKRLIVKKSELDFIARIEKAKYEVASLLAERGLNRTYHNGIDNSKEGEWMRLIEPYSGRYLISIHDEEQNQVYDYTITLNFTLNSKEQGHSITGSKVSAGGGTTIEKGFVNKNGEAWWHEKTFVKNNSNDEEWWDDKTLKGSLEILSKGKFDFEKGTFEGTWLTNTKKYGRYQTFIADKYERNHPELS